METVCKRYIIFSKNELNLLWNRAGGLHKLLSTAGRITFLFVTFRLTAGSEFKIFSYFLLLLFPHSGPSLFPHICINILLNALIQLKMSFY